MKKGLSLFLLLTCFCLTTLAQSRQITGQVRQDSSLENLSGVSVSLKGARTAVVTNAEGRYTINVPAGGNPVLVFTYVGYGTEEARVGDRAVVDVTLAKQASSLNDVVVVGYATVRRRDLTGSVSSVNSRQLRDIPINSAAQALAGKLAGVQVTGTEGSPGAEVVIRVRGGGSITQDNSPLYIIDGIQVENGLNSISPQDIQSVDVLKDASTTAIYGARGANGVVIITTKGGRNNRTTINYSGFAGVNKLANKLGVLKPYDFVLYQYDRSRGNATDSASFASAYGTTWDTLANYRNVPFTDWQDEMFGRNAFQSTHNVSLTGGNQSTQYNLSLTSNAEQGIQLGSDYNRKLVSFKFDHTLNQRVKVGFVTRYNNTTINGAGTSSSGSAGNNFLRQAIRYRPFLIKGQSIDYYDPNYALETNGNGLSLVNPILLNQAQYRKNMTDVLNLSGYADIRLAPFLTFRSTAGVDMTNTRQNAFDDTLTSNAKANGVQPIASVNTGKRISINNSNVLTYSNASSNSAFREKNDITVVAGQEIYELRTNANYVEARYFPVGIAPERALQNLNLGSAPAGVLQPRPTSSQGLSHLFSLFGNLRYAYDKKYLLSMSLRADGSTKFAQGHKWGYFPSGSFAWRISNEKFMERLNPTINDLKLRVSYGQAGNNRINDFLYLTQYGTGAQYGLNDALATGFSPLALANSNLVWETTTSQNLGLDASFLNSRIQLTLDVYRNITSDLLVNVPIPTSAGYTSQLQNVGSTSNKGVEIQLNGTPVQARDFTWTANFNISFNKNLVRSLGTYQKSYLVNSGWGFSNTPADYIVRVGAPVGSMWGFVTDGFYKVEDFTYDAATKKYTLKAGVANNTNVTQAPQPGLVKFKDLNGDGVVDVNNDRTIIGNANPKYFGGLNQQFTYKNFDASVYINFVVGNDIYNANKLEFTNGYTPNANLLDVVLPRWRNVNSQGQIVTDPAELAKLNAGATIWTPSVSSTSFVLHSWAVEDGSFARLNTITIGYNFSPDLLNRLKIKTARFYITASNLGVLTNYTGYDPEVSARRSRPETPGVDYSAYPRSRTFLFGVNLSL
ncbi:MAG: TonB-dependent receptor [Williamsia sp.]|nr:TonB-dependent receptor [Williamsia sp.]